MELNSNSTFSFKIYHKFEDCQSEFFDCDTTCGAYRIEDNNLILNSDEEEIQRKGGHYWPCLWFRDEKIFILNEDELLYRIHCGVRRPPYLVLRRKK